MKLQPYSEELDNAIWDFCQALPGSDYDALQSYLPSALRRVGYREFIAQEYVGEMLFNYVSRLKSVLGVKTPAMKLAKQVTDEARKEFKED